MVCSGLLAEEYLGDHVVTKIVTRTSFLSAFTSKEHDSDRSQKGGPIFHVRSCLFSYSCEMVCLSKWPPSNSGVVLVSTVGLH
jgi:hypothetical protein